MTWIDLGHIDPCIGLMLLDPKCATILLGSVDFPEYRKSDMVSEILVPFRLLAKATVSIESQFCPLGLLQASNMHSIVAHTDKSLITFSLSLSPSLVINTPLSSLQFSKTCCPPLIVDGDEESNEILHIFTTLQVERLTASSILMWARPMRRSWLCRTRALVDANDDVGHGDGVQIGGGAVSDAVCDLSHDSLIGLTPFRLVRCHTSNICAVIYRREFMQDMDFSPMSLDVMTIALVDFTGTPTLAIIEGRDVAFLPHAKSESPRGILLSRDGSSATYFTLEGSTIRLHSPACRPLVGVDIGLDYIDCRRIFSFTEGTKTNLAVLGERLRDRRVCFALGGRCESYVSPDSWNVLLPNIVTGRTTWLEPGEKVLSVVGLQGDGSGNRNFSMATSTRVVILSSALIIMAESRDQVCCSNLIPLGSFSLCYLFMNSVRYLCCLEGRFATGAVASIAVPERESNHTSLLAIMQDRVLYLRSQVGVSLVEHGHSPHIFLLPAASVRPALLLEPMVANAVCHGGRQGLTTPSLRSAIEKFGRKVSSITHGEKEGIGQLGAGISAKTFEILHHYGLFHAGSWLLSGSPYVGRSTSTKLLPPWLPVGPKRAAASNADAFLHLIANGDSYFTEYVKSPDKNMVSALPKKSSYSAYSCCEYAEEALQHGKARDAVKLLDVAGGESGDNLVLQLVLILGKDNGNDPVGVLKSMSGCKDGEFKQTSGIVTAPASLAGLAFRLKLMVDDHRAFEMGASEINGWIKPLAPSLQRGPGAGRPRPIIFGEKDLENAGGKDVDSIESLWATPCNESKHVW